MKHSFNSIHLVGDFMNHHSSPTEVTPALKSTKLIANIHQLAATIGFSSLYGLVNFPVQVFGRSDACILKPNHPRGKESLLTQDNSQGHKSVLLRNLLCSAKLHMKLAKLHTQLIKETHLFLRSETCLSSANKFRHIKGLNLVGQDVHKLKIYLTNS
jgi:hypothetical protein